MSKTRFISLVEVHSRVFNGNLVETKEHIGINCDRITHVMPLFSDKRSIIYVDGDGDGRTVDMDFDTLLTLLND